MENAFLDGSGNGMKKRFHFGLFVALIDVASKTPGAIT